MPDSPAATTSPAIEQALARFDTAAPAVGDTALVRELFDDDGRTTQSEVAMALCNTLRAALVRWRPLTVQRTAPAPRGSDPNAENAEGAEAAESETRCGGKSGGCDSGGGA